MDQNNNPPESSTTPTPRATSDPLAIGSVAGQLVQRILSRPNAPEVSDAEWKRQRDQEERSRRSVEAEDLARLIGKRYAYSSLASFELFGKPEDQEAQRKVIEQVKKFGQNMLSHTARGGGLILYGPPGTGKDHLLVSLMRHAILAHGLRVHWCNGQTLFGEFRDNIDKATSERELLTKYVRPLVLGISDPVPPKGEISNYAASMLYRIIEDRYRELKPTWVTVNVADAKEASKELSGPILDRLRDTSVAIFCNWPSYRQARKPEWLK